MAGESSTLRRHDRVTARLSRADSRVASQNNAMHPCDTLRSPLSIHRKARDARSAPTFRDDRRTEMLSRIRIAVSLFQAMCTAALALTTGCSVAVAPGTEPTDTAGDELKTMDPTFY